MSFRFVSKQRKTSNAVGMSSLIFLLQARERPPIKQQPSIKRPLSEVPSYL